jgi:hypothetical protein
LPFIVIVAVGSEPGVSVIDATLFGSLTVYAVVALANAGISVPLLILRDVRLSLVEAALVIVTV